LHVVEREHLGTTHADIGAYLLGLWGLPYDVIEAVARHHTPWPDVEVLDIATAVRLADSLASSVLLNDHEACMHCEPPLPELVEKLGVTEIVANVMARIHQS